MAELELTGVIIIESSILSTIIQDGLERTLSSISSSYSIGNSILLLQVKCINCQFNNTLSLTKNGPKCLRLARFNFEDKNIVCFMYKKRIH